MFVGNRGSIRQLIFTLLIVLVTGRAMVSNDYVEGQIQNDGFVKRTVDNSAYNNGPTVISFARHGLCNHRFGKVRFFMALQKHFHMISDDMKIAFILDICKRRDHMLTMWVEEIFDNDGDGFITRFERQINR
ncbi:hypothetical protein MAR_035709 [Mya arenaria]|uniref:EF-hand domain-containing protein n=1 Tax=Mya arenaria TaxID=6604 RepID=A0ABY7EKX7_MYAAR|nr:uncharacterized protein LOC128241458 [Mya arenaria]WAR10633.1 hypothetical protein MAR_035709 [Mya arenaria]